MKEHRELYDLFKKDFEKYYKPLCHYALIFLKDADHSEDIVQEIFLRVFEKKKELIGSKEIQFYLFTAVRNNCLSWLNKQKQLGLSTLTGREFTGEIIPEEKEEKTEDEVQAIWKMALNQLPPKCKEVFILSRLSKLTYLEISKTLGISVKTVENQMGKALRIMRDFLKGKGVFILAPFLLLSQHGVGVNGYFRF